MHPMAGALDKARTAEAVAKALLTVARSDYERARAARVKFEAEWQRTPGAQRAESAVELFERGWVIAKAA